MEKNKNKYNDVAYFTLVLIFLLSLFALYVYRTTIDQIPVLAEVRIERVKEELVGQLATITAYNTVEWQTDNSPCIASGGNICGRQDVVACPRDIPLHSWVEINGKAYECMDRTALKYDGRFDISFGKDVEGARKFGKQQLLVYFLSG